MSALARFAATAIALDIVHDVMDHVVQTDADAAAKARERDWEGAMFAHAGGQALAQGAMLAALETGRGRWVRVLAGTAVIGATHAFLDRRWPVVGLLRATGSERFAAPEVRVTGDLLDPRGLGGSLPLHGPYLADQSLHRAVTLVVAALMTLGG